MSAITKGCVTRVGACRPNSSTTYSTVASTKVVHGTVSSVTPSRKAAMGAKATTMIRSFTDTCTRV